MYFTEISYPVLNLNIHSIDLDLFPNQISHQNNLVEILLKK